MRFIDNTYKDLIDQAKLSFVRNDELLRIIEKVCYDDGMDKDSIWAIKECFALKETYSDQVK